MGDGQVLTAEQAMHRLATTHLTTYHTTALVSLVLEIVWESLSPMTFPTR